MSHVRTLGPKRYQARWNDPTGKPKTRIFAKKSDVEKWLTSMEHGKLTGAYVDPAASRMRVAEMADQWLATKLGVTPATRALYVSVLDVHVRPKWGTTPLARVDHAGLQTWIAELTASGMSAGHVHKIKHVTSGVLALAVRTKRLPANPCEGLELPRVKEKSRKYLTAAQVHRLALATSTLPPGRPRRATDAAFAQYRLVVLTLAFCGLRWGEMAALRVSSINLMTRRLRITVSVTEVNGSELVWGEPKDHESRSVPVPSFLVDELAQHLAGKAQNDLVFTAPDGGVLRNRNARRAWFDRAATEIGVEGLTPHELRHTAASLAVSAGANVKALQRMLGHASAALTLDRYADLFDDDLDAVADVLDRIARAAQSESSVNLPAVATVHKITWNERRPRNPGPS